MNSFPPDVLDYFGFQRNPFGKIQAGEELYESGEFRTAYRMIEYAARNYEMVALIGKIGSGKTEAVDAAVAMLEEAEGANMVFLRAAHSDKERMRISSVLDAFLQHFGIAKMPPSQEKRTWAVHWHITQAHQEGTRLCLIIDEAHRLSGQFLKSLKELHERSRFAHRASLFGIVLLGHDHLVRKFEQVAPDVWDRLEAGHIAHLGNMTPPEVADYIAQRMKAVSGNGLFSEEARLAIGRLAGSPLAVNKVCWQVMQAVYLAGGSREITEDAVLAALDRKALADRLALSREQIAQRAGLGKSTVQDVLDGRGGKDSVEAVDEVLRAALQGA